MMNYLLFFLFLMSFSTQSWAMKYSCTINTAPPGTKAVKDKLNLYIKKFSFDSNNSKTGKEANINNVSVYLWRKNADIFLAVKDLKQKTEFKTKYDLAQKNIFAYMSPHTEVNCEPESLAKKRQADAIQASLINESTNLFKSKAPLNLIIKKEIFFPYYQLRARDELRPIIFQGEAQFTADMEWDRNKDWCLMQINFKVKRDITLDKNLRIPVSQVSVSNNNKTHQVLNISFVNFSTGKKGFETDEFAAFSLECRVKKRAAFTHKQFQVITGGALQIVRPQ